MAGPLHGVRVVEIAGIGPAPFCGMLLADHGAEVIRVDRPGGSTSLVAPEFEVLNRSKRSIVLDLKSTVVRDVLRRLVTGADILIEGFRPGVMERLALGPDELLAWNPSLVYGRVTGWGQAGPYAQMAGHDLNYLALSGVLESFGPPDHNPTFPLNLIGDFGGGGMMLAFGVLSALLHARTTGHGQVIDAAMAEGSALLGSAVWGWLAGGAWSETRGTNLLDGAAPFYDTYETADGRFVAVGAVEPQFYAQLLDLAVLRDDELFTTQHDMTRWPAQKQRLRELFKSRTRDEWCRLFEKTDACFAPVLSLSEAPGHAQHQARAAFVTIDGLAQPAPAPRYSETKTDTPRAPARPGADTHEILAELGYDEIQRRQILDAAASSGDINVAEPDNLAGTNRSS